MLLAFVDVVMHYLAPLIAATILMMLAGLVKSVDNWILFSDVRTNPNYPNWLHRWLQRDDPTKYSQGNPFTAGLWHLCEGHLKPLIMGGMFVAGFYAGRYEMWFPDWANVVVMWLAWWWQGFWFKLSFHVWLMKDWTYQKWIAELP